MLKFLMPRRKKHQDEDLIRRKKKVEEAMDLIIEYQTEEEALELARAWRKRPLPPKETEDVVTTFREAKRHMRER